MASKRRQFLVLGVHRSGTSVLTAAAARLGLFAGGPKDLDAGDRWNEKGYWEHRGVRALNERALEALDTTWYGASGLIGDQVPEPRRTELIAEAGRIVAALDSRGPWVVKDPRLCVLLDLWSRVLDAPAYLLALRRPLAVAGSLRERDGFPLPLGLALWECHLQAALAGSEGKPRLAIWYEDLVTDPGPTILKVAGWLNRLCGSAEEPRTEIPQDLVEVRLCHQMSRRTEEARLLPASALGLLEALESGAAFLPGYGSTAAAEARELLGFVDGEARKARFLENGWRSQQAAHHDSVAAYEAVVSEKDRYIASLLATFAEKDRYAKSLLGTQLRTEGKEPHEG